MLLFIEDRLVSFVDGMVTDAPDLEDIMYEDASLHDPEGKWQMIFGVNTIPSCRRKGYAGMLIRKLTDMAREQGIKAGLLRPITLWPYPNKAFEKLKDTAKAFISVEMSMGQMVDDVRLAVECRKPVYFTGRTGGKIPNPNEVLKKITEVEGTL